MTRHTILQVPNDDYFLFLCCLQGTKLSPHWPARNRNVLKLLFIDRVFLRYFCSDKVLLVCFVERYVHVRVLRAL